MSAPSRGCSSTGFQQGRRVSSACTPFAASMGAVHLPSTKREDQMPTSGFFSAVPANHAATREWSFASTMVVAWQLGTGLGSKMNSDFTTAGSAASDAPERHERTNAMFFIEQGSEDYLERGFLR